MSHYEIARISRDQAIEIGRRLDEQSLDNELIFDDTHSVIARNPAYDFLSQLSVYINTMGILAEEVTPDDLILEQDRMTDDLIVLVKNEIKAEQVKERAIGFDDKRT